MPTATQTSKAERSAKVLSAAEAILAVLWQVGRGTVSAFFPEQYAKKYGYYSSPSYRTAVYRLRKQGYIKHTSRKIFTLTPVGKKQALWAFINGEIGSYIPPTPKSWDGGWRIIFFDIPEKKRRHRDFLRSVLKAVGFKEFQKSVWVYPHPVPSFLRDLLFEENIKKYTRFVTTENIDFDADLRRLFPETFFKKIG